ncbi:MAG: hypothetical protein LBM98_01735 [Oscillospiraceae bacterium]|nr:hypothetical protein [Oscillospiraceae bacterium]
MLRTCNALRIAGLPVLRNDGGGRFADTRFGRGLRNPGEASLAPTGLCSLFMIVQRGGRV